MCSNNGAVTGVTWLEKSKAWTAEGAENFRRVRREQPNRELQKRSGGLGRPPVREIKPDLETELRAEADSQIVVHAVVEENVVADFGAKSDWSDETFDASARIESKGCEAAAQAHCVVKTRRCSCVGHCEILEAHFAGHKETERA